MESRGILVDVKFLECFENKKFLKPPKAILLYRPPGTGVTKISTGRLEKVNQDVIIRSASDLVTNGKLENLVRYLFRPKNRE